jgi:hypothetical protein
LRYKNKWKIGMRWWLGEKWREEEFEYLKEEI